MSGTTTQKSGAVPSRIDNRRIFYPHAGSSGNIKLVAVDDFKIYVGYINDIVLKRKREKKKSVKKAFSKKSTKTSEKT